MTRGLFVTTLLAAALSALLTAAPPVRVRVARRLDGVASFASRAKATLHLYRRESGHWHLRNTVTMKRTSSGIRALLSASVKPRYAGAWRAIVRFGGAVGYAGKTSISRYFTVR